MRSELDSLVTGEGRLTPVACFQSAKGGGPWGLPWPGDEVPEAGAFLLMNA